MSDQPGSALGFVGVSTAGSSIQRVFPLWAEALGLPGAHLVGHDLPLGAPDGDYRKTVELLRDDQRYAGALVTSHKTGVYRAAGDLFDEVDRFGRLCGEVSAVSKRGGRLLGHAKDPLTAGLSLEEFLSPTHFTDTGGDVLVLGSGGAGTAIAWYLANRPDRPGRIVATSLDRGPLDSLGRILAEAAPGDPGPEPVVLEPVVVDGPADDLLRGLPPGSLVVNATGMGKDLPGSPVSDRARFPESAIAWEINYRGELDFLHQARAGGAHSVDGWRYFVHGWSQAIAEVFDLDIAQEDVPRLSELAEGVR